MGFADMAVVNGRIYTADPSQPWAEALAGSGEYVIAVGKERHVDPLVGPGTRVIEAGGRLVLPGFIDAHAHLIWGYILGNWIDLTDHPSLAEVQGRLREYARSHPDDPAIIGHGFDYVALAVKEGDVREALDGAVSDRPVLLSSWDGHTGLGNSKFTEKAEALAAKMGNDIGEMQRDPSNGRPTGVFHRVFDLTPLLPEFRQRRSLDGLRRTLAAASSFGITSAFDVQVNPDELEAYEALREAGELPLRIRVALYHPNGTPPDRYGEFEAARSRLQDSWLSVGAVKLYADGVQETGTAALLEPYANDPDSLGQTVYTLEELRAIVGEFDRRGFQVCIHACGDRGVRLALDALEGVRAVNGEGTLRHRIEHCENLSAEDIPRFRRLSVVPCMMPRHASPELTGKWREAVGPARTDAAFPWRELLDAGAALAFASDWPVADLNPLVGIQEALTHCTLAREASPHRLTMRQAIDCYTRGAAHACHLDASCGTLAVGKYADLVMLDKDLLEVPHQEVSGVRILKTIVGGRIVHPSGRIR